MPNGWSCVCCFLDIFIYKAEEDVVVPAKPIFDKSYVDDTYIRRKKNVNDKLFQKMNSYYLNIKLTLEENPRKFLDTMIIREINTISTEAFTKLTKFPVHWSSNIPINYKQKSITSELHRAKKPTMNFEKKIRRIKKIYMLVFLLSSSMALFSDSIKKKKNCQYRYGYLMTQN